MANAIPQTQQFHEIPTFSGMVASGVIAVVSAVALGVLFAIHSPLLGNTLFVVSVGEAGGAALAAFVLTTVITVQKNKEAARDALNHLNYVNLRQRVDALEADLRAHRAGTEAPEGRRVIDQVHETVPVLLQAGENAVKGLVEAHQSVTGRRHNLDTEIATSFLDVRELIHSNLSDRNSYFNQLLDLYGPGFQNSHLRLRNMIAANNSAANDKYVQVHESFIALEQGRNIGDIMSLLTENQNPAILAQLPQTLHATFSVDDDVLKAMGRQLLEAIFGSHNLEGDQDIQNALNALKAEAERVRDSGKFSKKMNGFLRLALQKATLDEEEVDQLCNQVIEHILNNQFKENIQSFLGLVARNFELLPRLLEEDLPKNEFFAEVDRILLLSESGHCINNTQRGRCAQLLQLQSEINVAQSDNSKVALVVRGEHSTEILDLCIQENSDNRANLAQIEARADVQELAQRLGVEIIAVPITTIADHPFKKLRDWRGTIRSFASYIAPLAKKILRERGEAAIKDYFPFMTREDREALDPLVHTTVEALFEPLRDGVIKSSSPFRTRLEPVIREQCQTIATSLNELMGRDEITVIEIMDEASRLIQGFADALATI